MESEKKIPIKKKLGSTIAKALVDFQGEVQAVVMDKTAKSDKSSYTYKYASFMAIINTIRPTLAKFRLAITQHPTTQICNGIVNLQLKTIVLHESGESIESELEMASSRCDVQAVGSLITYAKRYGLSAVLGIVTEDDDDGAGAQPDKRPDASQPPKMASTNAPNSERPTRATKSPEPPKEPSDSEQAGRGLINKSQVTRLLVERNKSKISKDKYVLWLRAFYGYNTSWEISIDNYESILEVIITSPNEIIGFAPNDDVVA